VPNSGDEMERLIYDQTQFAVYESDFDIVSGGHESRGADR